MKLKKFLYAIFPVFGNKSINEKVRKKLKDEEGQEKLDTPLNMSSNPDAITNDHLKRQYEESLKVKDKFEDKAKATIVCVTVSVSLIMGASGLLTTLTSRFDYPLVRWASYVFFLYAVLSMIAAAIMDIKVLAEENRVYIIPLDTADEDLREAYDIYTGKNWAQNIIRNNYVFTAYECIRNALICLFIIMAIAVIPLHDSETTTQSNKSSNIQRGYSYNETTLDSLGQHDATEIRDIIENALPAMQTVDGQTYSIVDNANALFIKFQLNGNDINVLSIEEISWEQ